MVTVTDFLVWTLPTPSQSEHWLERGMVLPTPPQTLHVLAIWKPPSITKVRWPDPPQAVHVNRLAPFFIPLPEHVGQLTIGVTLTFLLVPLAAS